jgi:ketosteroid isomerase-like protein
MEGIMSNHGNVEIVKQVYAAFGKGDLQALLGLLGADVDWAIPGSAPWSGEGRGHDYVQRFFQTFGSLAALDAFEPRSFLAEGDRVAVFGYEEGTVRETGRAWKSQFTHLFTLANGKVTAHREYADTEAIAKAVHA